MITCIFYLFIFIPIVQFDHRPAVLYWLSGNERRHKSTEKLANKTGSVIRSGSMQHKMHI